MYTNILLFILQDSLLLPLLICMSKSSTSKEKHANPNLPPIYENNRSQFRFVSPQDRIGDKNHISKDIKPLLKYASA